METIVKRLMENRVNESDIYLNPKAQEILDQYQDCRKYRNRDEYSSGFCDAVESMCKAYNLDLVRKTEPTGKSTVRDFSKIKVDFARLTQYSWRAEEMTPDEFREWAKKESSRGLGPELSGHPNANFYVICASSDYSYHGIYKIYCVDSLEEAERLQGEWLARADKDYKDSKTFKTQIIDIANLKSYPVETKSSK